MNTVDHSSRIMRRSFFITGTDTGVGKTLVTTALLRSATGEGLRTIGLKPIAAGAERTDQGLRNEDAVQIAAEASVPLSYQQINPVVFDPPIAPHIAAEQADRKLSAARIIGVCRGALMQTHDFCLVEGAGGWRVPIGPRESMADIAKGLAFPVILVVGLRLGCLNHALLTAEAISRDGLRIAGWVANIIDPKMSMRAENIATLRSCLPCPLIGEIPHLDSPSPQRASSYLDISKLTLVSQT